MMNLKELVEVCRAYHDLGWAVQEQLKEKAQNGEIIGKESAEMEGGFDAYEVRKGRKETNK